MDRYKIAELNGRYFSYTQGRDTRPIYTSTMLPYERLKNRSKGFESDTHLLKEVLKPFPPSYKNLAQQVFGHQALQEKLSLKQLLNLLEERYQIHARHIANIQHRNMKCQEQLCAARWNWRLDRGIRALNLERLLINLEDKKRQEDLDFWKDTNELRQKALEQASEYAATRRRARWLEEIEGETNVFVSEYQD